MDQGAVCVSLTQYVPASSRPASGCDCGAAPCLTHISSMTRLAVQCARDERVLWTGAPRRGWFLGGDDLAGIIFAPLFFLPQRDVWSAAIAGEVDPASLLLALLIASPGIWLVFVRPFASIRRRANRAYALTNQRAIIQSGATLRSFPIDELWSARMWQHRDGTGTIGFSWSTRMVAGNGMLGRGSNARGVFERISRPHDVMNTIAAALNDAGLELGVPSPQSIARERDVVAQLSPRQQAMYAEMSRGERSTDKSE